MVIVYRVKPAIENGKKIYKVQRSTIPFIWTTVSTYTDREAAIKETEKLNHITSRIF